jgi:hypothetical protein
MTRRLKFRRAGLDRLRTDITLHEKIKIAVADGEMEAAILFVALIACSDSRGRVSATDEQLADFIQSYGAELERMVNGVVEPR